MGQVKCHACGALVFEGDAYCTECGTALGATTQLVQDDSQPASAFVCPVCGSQYFEGDLYCTYCSHPLTNSGGGGGSNDTWPPPSPSPDGIYRTVPAEPIIDVDHPTARPKCVRLTHEEAQNGCKKTVEVEGNSITVELPAGIGWKTKLDVPGLGYPDEVTGERGPLRLSFRLV